ncbi:hypothetical protein BHM03_00026989 [Ensete ventricosum]|nr:hypothetical protein BHM03_00026989 [Ensete ventricosum]
MFGTSVDDTWRLWRSIVSKKSVECSKPFASTSSETLRDSCRWRRRRMMGSEAFVSTTYYSYGSVVASLLARWGVVDAINGEDETAMAATNEVEATTKIEVKEDKEKDDGEEDNVGGEYNHATVVR